MTNDKHFVVTTLIEGILKRLFYFEKGITEETARRVLRRFGYRHHPGADSQMGRDYFYESGPPFFVYAPVDEVDVFVHRCEKRIEVKDVYEADFGVQKD